MRHIDHPYVTLLLSCSSDVNFNCIVPSLDCPCGEQHIVVRSTQDLYAGSLVVPRKSDLTKLLELPHARDELFDYLLVQTDGSFTTKQHATQGGGGVVFFGCKSHELPVAMSFRAIQFPQATDSMHAKPFYLIIHQNSFYKTFVPWRLNSATYL